MGSRVWPKLGGEGDGVEWGRTQIVGEGAGADLKGVEGAGSDLNGEAQG